MSDSLIGVLMQQLGPDAIGKIAQQLGTDNRSTNRAVAGALPALLDAITNNASDKNGAEALDGALSRDHDGSLLDNLGGFLDSPDLDMGSGILRHVLGGRQDDVQQKLGATSGVDGAKMASLLAMLAPIVMGALGKARAKNNLDAGGLGDMLQNERTQAGASADLGGIGKMLDRDGDGNFMDDLAKMGTSLLGGYLKSRR